MQVVISFQRIHQCLTLPLYAVVAHCAWGWLSMTICGAPTLVDGLPRAYNNKI